MRKVAGLRCYKLSLPRVKTQRAREGGKGGRGERWRMYMGSVQRCSGRGAIVYVCMWQHRGGRVGEAIATRGGLGGPLQARKVDAHRHGEETEGRAGDLARSRVDDELVLASGRMRSWK